MPRKHYRVDLDELDEVEVTMHTAAGAVYPCRSGNISFGGVGLKIDVASEAENTGLLENGEEVEFRFQSHRFPDPLSVTAHAVRREVQDGVVRYGFLFSDRENFAEVESPLHRIFNRRKHFRVEPNPDHALKVLLMDQRTRKGLAVWLVDLSEGGVGLGAILAQASDIRVGDRVDLELWLPEAAEPLDLVGTVRSKYRPAVAGGFLFNVDADAGADAGAGADADADDAELDDDTPVRLGVEFDWSAISWPQRKQQQLHDYVMERQREYLRVGK